MQLNFKNPFQSLLLVEKQGCYLEQFVHDYAKKIVCLSKENEFFCNKCINCLKIDNNNYYDFFIVDGLNEGITKDKILHIQNSFMHGGLEEGNKKIYLIKQVEKGTKEALNFLLKFLEEPPSHTYAILTTRNENLVLPTILSRCQKYFLIKEKNFDFNLLMKKLKISDLEMDILSKLYWTIDDLIFSIKNKDHLEILKFLDLLLKKIKTIDEMGKLQDLFKNLSYRKIELVLNYLLHKLNSKCHENILKILSILSINPIKSALFWEIIKIVEVASNE